MINTTENLQKLSDIRLFALDMDGTIYLGNNPIGDMTNTLKYYLKGK